MYERLIIVGCRNLDADFKAMSEAMEANLLSNTR